MILCKIYLLVFIQLKIDDSKNLLFLHKRNAPKIIVKFAIFSKNHVNNGNEVFNSSWNPSIPKSASVWTVIECFMNEETLCRSVHSELLRNVYQSHNLTRARTHAAKMKELRSICTRSDKFTPDLYFDAIASII